MEEKEKLALKLITSHIEQLIFDREVPEAVVIREINIIQMTLLFEIRDYLKAINSGVWAKSKRGKK